MIYLDVTVTCQSPMNTGVQRAVRGIFRSLRDAGTPVTPLVWEPRLDSFCTLASREFGYLEQPFAGKSGKAFAQPGKTGRGVPVLTKLWGRATHRRNRIDLAAKLMATDVFFAPEIFKDSRRDWLNGLGSRILARRVAVFHDAIAWRHPELASPASRKGFVEYVMALSTFDAIIAVSQASAEDLRACWKSQGVGIAKMPTITVIGWPVDELFAAGSASPARGQSKSNAPPKVLCVGTLEARKNQLALLTASEQLWRDGLCFELVLIGRTTTPFGRRVLAEVKRLRAAGWPIVWRRHVDDAALLAAYEECAFTVFPSLAEGFGLPIIESLRRGRLCICGVNGALGEVAGGGCLVVDQTDPVALGGATKQLLTNLTLYERLSAEARARRFASWQDYAAKLLPVLNSPDVR